MERRRESGFQTEPWNGYFLLPARKKRNPR